MRRPVLLTFISVLIGIIAISGVPPLTGFGGKWLLLNALFEKGWYWQAGLVFFASGVAFLYLFRLIHTVFLGQRKLAHKDLREASWLLLPQILLIVVVIAFSIWPKLLIDPVSAAIANHFPQTLAWEGSTLKTHLGYWDAFTIINIVAAIFLAPLLILLFLSRFMQIQKVRQFNIVFAAERPQTPETTHYAYNFYSFYEKAFGAFIKPRATAFWDGVNEWGNTVGSALRLVYTGNGQTYALYVLFYLGPVFRIAGGVGTLAVVPVIYGSEMFSNFSFAGDLLLAMYFIFFGQLGMALGAGESGHPFSAIGVARGLGQMTAYEAPFALAIIAVVVQYDTLSITEIVAAQQGGMSNRTLFTNPLAVIAAMLAFLGMSGYPPFDVYTAPNEIPIGPPTEYNSSFLAMMAANGGIFAGAKLILFMDLFFGGATGIIEMVIKTWAIYMVAVFVGASFPRFRVDQSIRFFLRVPTLIGIASVAFVQVFLAG